jgi:integrase
VAGSTLHVTVQRVPYSQAGATPAVVQKQLRHSDPRITLGIYGHVIGNQQRDAVENRSARIE